MSKKNFVKEYIIDNPRIWTMNGLHRTFNGKDVRGAWQYHTAILDVSMTTIRKAVQELQKENRVELYYRYGDCYDYLRIKVL